MNGKETCGALKQIRRQIAEANDIPLEIPECTYEGPCEGTCPRCEAEICQLQEALQAIRDRGGKPVIPRLDLRQTVVFQTQPERERYFTEDEPFPEPKPHRLAGVPVRPLRDYTQEEETADPLPEPPPPPPLMGQVLPPVLFKSDKGDDSEEKPEEPKKKRRRLFRR